MLKITKNITMSGNSTIDGVVVETYTASLNEENPEEFNLSSYQVSKELYKTNREQCRADRAEFEDAVYTLQDQMLAEKRKTNE